MKRVVMLFFILFVSFTVTSCQFVADRLLDRDSLYGGGYLRDGTEINIRRPDIGRAPYVEDRSPLNPSNLAIYRPSLPQFLEGYSYSVFLPDLTSVREVSRRVVFDSEDAYSILPGITTFRGSNYRNSSSFGYPVINNKTLTLVWQVPIGNIDAWSGVGWTGQPAIVKWPFEIQQIMNMFPMFRDNAATVEIIYGALDGKIHFLDLMSGIPTRPAIDSRFPIKGSVTVDPRGYPLLYFGQGINRRGGTIGRIGYHIYSLIDHSQLFFLDGNDPNSLRDWTAFDSSALIDRHSDTLILGGENGLLYSMDLNTRFDLSGSTVSVNPLITRFQYIQPFGHDLGIENSPAIFKNFVFFADNGGLLHCVDLNTLKPVWLFNLRDDTDSTVVLDVYSEDDVFLYTATSLDINQEGGVAYIRKFHALTGHLIWERTFRCFYNPTINGGVLATPVVGKHSIDHLVIFTIARTGSGSESGAIVALHKETGDVVWRHEMERYSWSSPTVIYDKDGNAFLIQCDAGSQMSLLDAKTGEVLYILETGGIIEGSPAVYNNMIVVGTRSQLILGVRID